MKLTVINSGSSGNCYILENENTALIIECGVPFKEIKQALNFNLTKVAGVLVTHEHLDHCKSVKEVVGSGLTVYCSKGTWERMPVTGTHRIIFLASKEGVQIGEFKVTAFHVKHDAAEPLGFVIHHPDTGNILFITDSYYVSYTFPGLNHILVEANYCPDILERRLQAGNIHPSVQARVINSHMSIDTCKDLLRANKLTSVRNIMLIHLSDGNSNAEDFKRQVEELTGKTVYIASKNLVINLNKTAF